MASGPNRSLKLADLWQGLPGLSETWGRFLSEAAAVCFVISRHPNGIGLHVDGLYSTAFGVYWEEEVTDDVLKGWDVELEGIEYGACGVAILLMLELTEVTVIER